MENDRAKFKIEFKQRLYNWVLKLIKYINSLPRTPVNDVMGKQLLRSGTSSKKDFINFFTHALKSANESKVWIALLRDTCKTTTKEIQWLLSELIEIANVLASSILTLKGKK